MARGPCRLPLGRLQPPYSSTMAPARHSKLPVLAAWEPAGASGLSGCSRHRGHCCIAPARTAAAGTSSPHLLPLPPVGRAASRSPQCRSAIRSSTPSWRWCRCAAVRLGGQAAWLEQHACSAHSAAAAWQKPLLSHLLVSAPICYPVCSPIRSLGLAHYAARRVLRPTGEAAL